MKIDRHTETWQAVERWLKERRDSRVHSLINGSATDERHRGEIRLIDDLLDHASEDKPPAIVPDTY